MEWTEVSFIHPRWVGVQIKLSIGCAIFIQRPKSLPPLRRGVGMDDNRNDKISIKCLLGTIKRRQDRKSIHHSNPFIDWPKNLEFKLSILHLSAIGSPIRRVNGYRIRAHFPQISSFSIYRLLFSYLHFQKTLWNNDILIFHLKNF